MSNTIYEQFILPIDPKGNLQKRSRKDRRYYSGPCYLLLIPKDIVRLVIQHLDSHAFTAFSVTCKAISHLTQDPKMQEAMMTRLSVNVIRPYYYHHIPDTVTSVWVLPNGSCHGTEEITYSNGALRKRVRWVNDWREGQVLTYDINGFLIHDRTYRDNFIDGHDILYYSPSVTGVPERICKQSYWKGVNKIGYEYEFYLSGLIKRRGFRREDGYGVMWDYYEGGTMKQEWIYRNECDLIKRRYDLNGVLIYEWNRDTNTITEWYSDRKLRYRQYISIPSDRHGLITEEWHPNGNIMKLRFIEGLNASIEKWDSEGNLIFKQICRNGVWDSEKHGLIWRLRCLIVKVWVYYIAYMFNFE